MKLSINAIKLLKEVEGNKLKSYKDSAGIWTIGYGNITYEDGSSVKEGEIITQARAELLLNNLFPKYYMAVEKLVKSAVNQNQKDALAVFCYNIGIGAFSSSTVLKRVNLNPNDVVGIKEAFGRWVYAGDGTKNKKDDDGDGLIDEPGEKQKVEGLVNRHLKEVNLYFKPQE